MTHSDDVETVLHRSRPKSGVPIVGLLWFFGALPGVLAFFCDRRLRQLVVDAAGLAEGAKTALTAARSIVSLQASHQDLATAATQSIRDALDHAAHELLAV